MADIVVRVQTAATAATSGEPVVVIDPATDEAVLVLSAEAASAGSVAFLVRHGSGFLCAATHAAVLQRLRIPLSPVRERPADDHEFGIAVDAVGTGTGISASARAETLRRLADPAAAPEAFSRPGHVMTVRVIPSLERRRLSPAAAAIELILAGGAEPVACYTHLVGIADPTVLASVREAEEFARDRGLAVVSTTDLARADSGILWMSPAAVG